MKIDAGFDSSWQQAMRRQESQWDTMTQSPTGQLVQLLEPGVLADVAEGPAPACDAAGVTQLMLDPAQGESSGGLPAKLFTLGCKVNQYETEYVRTLLHHNGYRDAHADEPARLAVINTCTVTAESDRKSRQLIRQIGKKNPDAKIVVMGCYAANDPQTVARLPQVASVITDKRHLDQALRPFGVKKTVRGLKNFKGRNRAFVKVQDGCLLNCTFCIIPQVRPGMWSRPADDVVNEVRELVQQGYREIVLAGIHLGHFGIDLSKGKPRDQWCRLWHLLDRLASLPGEFRLRLSSLEAAELTDDFIKVLGDYQEKICPHLHLSLQSGSNRILKAMKRRYRIERFLSRCDLIRDRLDEPAFSTDIIVGFPGETVQDFEETLQAARDAEFVKIHMFPFSARKGTPAAEMTEKAIPKDEMKRRKSALAEVESANFAQYADRLMGRRLEMLVEGPLTSASADVSDVGNDVGALVEPSTGSAVMMKGTACRYFPLHLETLPSVGGQLVPVKMMRRLDHAIEVVPWADQDG